MICYMSLYQGSRFCLSTQNKTNLNWFFRIDTRSTVRNHMKDYDPMCDETIFLALGKYILETHERNDLLQERNVITTEK